MKINEIQIWKHEEGESFGLNIEVLCGNDRFQMNVGKNNKRLGILLEKIWRLIQRDSNKFFSKR